MFLANHVIDGVLCAYPRCYSWGCQNNMDVRENLARLISEFVETEGVQALKNKEVTQDAFEIKRKF